jgi:hypothetical protein
MFNTIVGAGAGAASRYGSTNLDLEPKKSKITNTFFHIFRDHCGNGNVGLQKV